jgi:maltooligosyltrehalose trehalohydrolase
VSTSQKGDDRRNQDCSAALARSEISQRRWPIGIEVDPGVGAHFRVWAPRSKTVFVELMGGNGKDLLVELGSEEDGYFGGLVAEAEPGMLYRCRLDHGTFPDPASRFQPQGPHGPSQIVDPSLFRWTDDGWNGITAQNQVIYEMHVGTFTQEGTWASAAERLSELADLGITLIELMPVAEFPGRFGWGYDGVCLFAPTRLYGQPDEFRAFVNRAHSHGVGVILDVVYNHFGPDGGYMKEFSEDYVTSRYVNEWGEAINFDGPRSGPVREFFLTNAGYWIDEYHLDGLRLDATQQIFDSSSEHIIGAIGRQVRGAAQGRSAYLVAENEPQHSRLVRPLETGGHGLDALWNDDFHHSMKVALTGRTEAYFTDYRGTAQELISAVKWGYLFQGQFYRWQKKRRGAPAYDLEPWRFVNYVQNHDQIANSLRGLRLHQLTSPGRLRAATALLLLGPGTPMLFQGQEFAASAPFLYFADHHPELAKLVAQGRREFLSQFPAIASAESQNVLNDPADESTFRRCKLDFAEREKHADVYALHRDLLLLRRQDEVLRTARGRGGLDGAVLAPEAFVLRFFGGETGDRLLLINFGSDLRLDPAPEPLLAPLEDCAWRTGWSSEHPSYGGGGTPEIESEKDWSIPGHAAVWLVPEVEQTEHGQDHP